MAKNRVTKEKANFQVPNLERALQILEYLVDCDTEKSQREISLVMGFPVNSVMRILNALEYYGYVSRNTENKKYSLTHKFTVMGKNNSNRKSLMEASMDVMQKLRDEFSETVVLSIIDGDQGLVLDQVEGTHPFRFVCNPGTKQAIHCSASCKAILAFISEIKRKQIISEMKFEKLTKNTITSTEEFKKELEEVKENGYALDKAEALEGVNCVAAPIFNNTGDAVAALTITGPSSRIPRLHLIKMGKKLKKEAITVSKLLGYPA